MAHFGESLRLMLKKQRLSQRAYCEASDDLSLETLHRAFKKEDPIGLQGETYRSMAKGFGLTVGQFDKAWQSGGELPDESQLIDDEQEMRRKLKGIIELLERDDLEEIAEMTSKMLKDFVDKESKEYPRLAASKKKKSHRPKNKD